MTYPNSTSKRRLHSSEITPYSNASRRTRQRWKAHTNNQCKSKCRFCRQDRAKFSPKQTVLLRVPNPLPAPYSQFGKPWRDWITKLNGYKIILSSWSRMSFNTSGGYGLNAGFAPGWIFQETADLPKDRDCASLWVPSEWLQPCKLNSGSIANDAERYRKAVRAKVKKDLAKLLGTKTVKQHKVSPSYFKPVPAKDTQMQTDNKTAEGALQHEVGYHYVAAAANVARSKAQAEINLAALTPGMKVWHAFEHQPCILIEQTEDGWVVEDKKGERQTHVNPAILRPIKPNIFKRSWAFLIRVACLSAIAYHNKVNSIGWNEGGSTRASTAVGITFGLLAVGFYLHTYGFNLPGPR